ncbi:MAG: hypothetical protein ACI857_002431 [Arenicella sp.]
MRLIIVLISLLTLGFVNEAKASHIMGGEITWKCLGSGNYEFDLVLYRDCNGLDIVDPTLNLEVWGHGTVTTIQCDLFSTVDLSPECTELVGFPIQLECGVGSQSGNGPGAVQKYTYRSAPIQLAGTPPATGWAFTYDSFSRNWGLTNIDNPAAFGITLSAIMYAVPGGSANPCTDSSPQFAQDPYMLLCAGTDVQYNSNAFDPDNDSLVYSWGIPLDHFPAGAFNPPVNPAPVPYVFGFSFSNPTPDVSFDPGNIPATMDGASGDINFMSNTVGNFGMVQKIDSYREGQLVSTIHREFQMIVIPCPGYVNTAPTITPPFAGNTSFEAEFFAGDLINFDIIIADMENLQDGTPQTVTLNPTGNYFGTGLTNAGAGCEYTPCATLDQPPLIQGVQGLTTNFNWQTSCDHLLDGDGVQQSEQIYDFVLNAQDDYCSVPGRTYETIRIKLKNRPEILAVDLHCIDVLPNGDVDLTWTQTSDPGTSFVEYQVWSIEDGFIASIPAITTENYTVVGANADLSSKHYFIQTQFGCDGNNLSPSDTLASIFLTLNDLGDGRAQLNWNSTHTPMNAGDNPMQEIYREYPVGTWTLRATVPYGENTFLDTIDICNEFLSYEIVIPNAAGCSSTSNAEGAQLGDIINPYIPVLNWVSVDTTSQFVNLSWDVNISPDTYGYVIYVLEGGFWVAKDTAWGINNTSFSYALTTSAIEPESFRITAFDSCFTNAVPATYQTSALSNPHTTIHLDNSLEICDRNISLTWTDYLGWSEGVNRYEVIASIGGSTYDVVATLAPEVLSYEHVDLIYDVNYCYYIRAVSNNDSVSYSNRNCRYVVRPSTANFHYLATASHNLMNEIEVLLYTDGTASVTEYEIEVRGPQSAVFDVAGTLAPNGTDFIPYFDSEISPERGAYEYQISIIDSCGNRGETSNIGRTVYLKVEVDHVAMQNILAWSAYQGFDADIVQYNIYRGENGIFPATPFATTLAGVRSYTDDVSNYLGSEGQFCYRIEAVEGTNSYGFGESAFSNTVCATLDPIVYIPNAFFINGANPIFLPIVSLYDFDTYSLTIYDRWGAILFNTDDAYQGWDGRNRFSKIVSEGVYVYYLTIKDRDGKEYQFRNTVTMLIDEY